MDPADLKSGDYDGTYKFISGGEISLDFINTVSWPGTTKEHDWLDQPENIIAWALEAGIIDEQVQDNLDRYLRDCLKEEVNHVHDIRKKLRRVLKPFAYDKQPRVSAIEALNNLLHQASRYRCIDPNGYQWMWKPPKTLTEIINPVIWNTAHVLTNLDHARIGHCPSCHWLFYDTTRNRSRKWCDMEDCGSRHKALRYYHRTKSVDDSRNE